MKYEKLDYDDSLCNQVRHIIFIYIRSVGWHSFIFDFVRFHEFLLLYLRRELAFLLIYFFNIDYAALTGINLR